MLNKEICRRCNDDQISFEIGWEYGCVFCQDGRYHTRRIEHAVHAECRYLLEQHMANQDLSKTEAI
jgi:hypothetical protein